MSTQINSSLDFLISNFFLKLSFLILRICYNLVLNIIKVYCRYLKPLLQSSMASIHPQHVSKIEALWGPSTNKSLLSRQLSYCYVTNNNRKSDIILLKYFPIEFKKINCTIIHNLIPKLYEVCPFIYKKKLLTIYKNVLVDIQNTKKISWHMKNFFYYKHHC